MNQMKKNLPIGKICFTALFVILAAVIARCLTKDMTSRSMLVLAAAAAVCAGGILIAWLPLKMLRRPFFSYAGVIAASLFFFAMVEFLSMNMAHHVLPMAMVLNAALIAGAALLLGAIFGHTAPGGITAGVLCLTLGIINHYTLLYRGSVVLPSDVFSASTAGQVLGNYDMSPDDRVCAALAGAMLVFVLLYRTNHKPSRKGRIISGCWGLALLAAVSAVSASQPLAVRLGVAVNEWDLWNQTSRSHEIGFLLNGTESVQHLFPDKPDGFSSQAAGEILAAHEPEETAADSDAPNIIVIMAEAFSDLRVTADFETDTGYLDNFYRIAKEPDSKTGRCVVSIFGGMTSCSEFEFLTGCSMYFLESAAAPYRQYVRSELTALPAYLTQAAGYQSSALHPFEPANWNRKAAYPLLGFHEFLSTENPEFQSCDLIRGYVADSVLFDLLARRSNNAEQPHFDFAITMQGHGGFDYPGYESTVELTGAAAQYSEVAQYLSVLKNTDEAFGSLIEDLKTSDQPTIVLIFGDHLPAFSSDFYTACAAADDGSAEAFVRNFSTPYLFWSNCGADFSEVPDLISANFLAPYLLKAAGIPLNNYYQYLYDLSRQYPVISRNGLVNADGMLQVDMEGNACYDILRGYEYVQFDFLFGKH